MFVLQVIDYGTYSVKTDSEFSYEWNPTSHRQWRRGGEGKAPLLWDNICKKRLKYSNRTVRI